MWDDVVKSAVMSEHGRAVGAHRHGEGSVEVGSGLYMMDVALVVFAVVSWPDVVLV
jgi:hypothetical protein